MSRILKGDDSADIGHSGGDFPATRACSTRFLPVQTVCMGVMSDISFDKRVANNGVKLKNVPNSELRGDKFTFADYVAKDPMSWVYVPENPEDVDVEAVAEDMYEIYEGLADEFDEVTVERQEDEMYWAEVTVEVPDDPGRQERVAEQVAEAILARQQL